MSPESFIPERFLKQRATANGPEFAIDPDVRDPMEAAFGFGRRICPGRYMAYESLWISIISILATYDIQTTRDGNGQEIIPSEAYCDGFVRCVRPSNASVLCSQELMSFPFSHPLPFVCKIVPRSQKHANLIREAEERL